MDDRQLTIFVVAIVGLVVPVSLGLALWLVARMRRRSDRPLSPAVGGGVVVPVRGLKRSRFLGHSQNSISPRLEIADGGLRFKVFRPDHWRFADIAEVDAPRLPFVTRLAIRHRTAGTLYVDLGDAARAQAFLRAMPADLPWTPRAAALRDGSA